MKTTQAAIVVGLLTMLPASGFAQSTGGTSPATSTASSQPSQTSGSGAQAANTAKSTMHATKGVVKFVDGNKLVIARSPRYGMEMSFILNPTTERVGNLKVGSTVDVRYRTEAEKKIATAVSVEHPKQPPSAPGSQQ
jgi:hypothetical protein